MSSLVSELLLFSKAELNSSGTPLTNVNLADIVERVVSREVPESVAVERRLSSSLEVRAHPEYLSRTLANVIRNAVRYAGGDGPIVITGTPVGETVSVFIADSGPGLPPDELDKIFKPFYRPELARQRDTGGTGLGLAIVKSCVDACGGTVICRNRKPHGLEIEIQLAKGHPAVKARKIPQHIARHDSTSTSEHES